MTGLRSDSMGHDETSEFAHFTSGVHLWRSVIKRAVEEAEGKIFAFELGWKMRALGAVESKGFIKRSARGWLVNDTVFLRRVVEMASLPVDYETFLSTMQRRFPKEKRDE